MTYSSVYILWKIAVGKKSLKTLKNKGPKKFFTVMPQKTHFGSLKNHFSKQFLENSFYFIFRNFSTIKNLLCNGRVPWMLKVLQGTMDTNKEPLFLKVKDSS